jgi:uncharacterized protein
VSQSRAAWAEIHSEPERFIVAGDKIIVFVQPEDGTEWHEARIADVFTFRNGKAMRRSEITMRRACIEPPNSGATHLPLRRVPAIPSFQC